MAKPKKIKLNDKDNDFTGTNKNDVVFGNGGDDEISGGRGNDKLNGGDGNDVLRGGSGEDRLNGGAGDDVMVGGSGDDTFIATQGNDTIDGGSGDDVVRLSGNFADAQVTENPDGSVRIAIGTQVLNIENVELFRFDDGLKTLAELIPQPVTFTLTTGVDKLTGSATDDVFVADPANNGQPTLNNTDVLDGGDGSDMITIFGYQDIKIAEDATVSNIEKLQISANNYDVEATVGATWTGLKEIEIIESYDLEVETNGNVETVTVRDNNQSVAITDKSATDTLKTVVLDDVRFGGTIKSDALTSLTISDWSDTADEDVIIQAKVGTRELALTLDGVGNADSAEPLRIWSPDSTQDFYDNTATSLVVDTKGSNNFGDFEIDDAKTVTVKGSGTLFVDTLKATDLTSIDASANTGGVYIHDYINATAKFTGGAGTDGVGVKATTQAIAMGAGDDIVFVDNAVIALGAGGSLDGGDGKDELILGGGTATAVSATKAFGDAISNFEYLTIENAGGAVVDLANLDNPESVLVDDDVTLKNLTSAASVVFDADYSNGFGAGADSTISIANAATGIDTLNLELSGANSTDFGKLNIASIETLNLTTTDTNDTPQNIQHELDLYGTGLTQVKVTGNAGVAMDLSNVTGVTSVNTAGVTNGAVAFLVADGTSVTFTGGKTDSYFDAAALTGANKLTATTGDGNDEIWGGDAADSITTGSGDDYVNGGAGADVIDTGSGNDGIYGGLGGDKITTGAGADILYYSFATDSQGVNFDTITDFSAASDKFDFSGFGFAAGDYLGEVASNPAGILNGVAGEVVLDLSSSSLWVDVDGDGLLDATNDLQIRLVGVTDLNETTDVNFIF